MNDKIGTSITDSVERVLRYIIPGVAFTLLFALSYPSKFEKVTPIICQNSLTAFLAIITLGMTIYIIHSQVIKFTLELIAFKLGMSPVNAFCEDKDVCSYSKALAELTIERNKSDNYPKNYYIYLWSIVHYSLILSYLLVSFSFLNEYKSLNIILFRVGMTILTLSICSYFKLQVLEKDTTVVAMRENKSEKIKNVFE